MKVSACWFAGEKIRGGPFLITLPSRSSCLAERSDAGTQLLRADLRYVTQ